MSSDALALIELILVFGLVMGFGVYQLRSVRKSLRESQARESAGHRAGPDSTEAADGRRAQEPVAQEDQRMRGARNGNIN